MEKQMSKSNLTLTQIAYFPSYSKLAENKRYNTTMHKKNTRKKEKK